MRKVNGTLILGGICILLAIIVLLLLFRSEPREVAPTLTPISYHGAVVNPLPTATQIPPTASFESECQHKLKWYQDRGYGEDAIYDAMERDGCLHVHGVEEFLQFKLCEHGISPNVGCAGPATDEPALAPAMGGKND